MNCDYACRNASHLVARRTFLGQLVGGLGATALGLGSGLPHSLAHGLHQQQKRVLCIFMSGGLSQLESWDPKPGADTGGPCRSIPTSVPGVHISDLLPKTAGQMHRLNIVRGLNTSEDDHGKGRYLMEKGRREMPGFDYPHLGAVAARAITPAESALPGHVHITPGGGGGTSSDAAYLGPRYASVVLGGGNPPQNSARPESLSEAMASRRDALRKQANDHFARRRRTAETDAYTYSYEQAAQLMQRRDLFDVAREPAAEQDRYGRHDFGRHCLLARRLLEAGVTFVQVSHSNYDTHNENFNFHVEQLGEFDGPFATLVADLADRGLLEHTLVVVMSEFGRTPNINQYYGRDHWSKAWSVVLGGAGIQVGGAFGKTNDRGTEVTDHQVDHGQLFHTYLTALGLDSRENFDIGGRKMPLADPAAAPISELLA
ncbi:MAG: DUF1501 domain-containing protein [Pirellulales bacterium]